MCLWFQGCPREAVWDYPAAGRGAEQLPSEYPCTSSSEERAAWSLSTEAAGARGEEVVGSDSPCPQDIVTMQLCANKLDKKDFFGKSDPFLVFYRSNEDGT